MKWSVALIFLAFMNMALAQMPSPNELLEKSIQYHDPNGNWGKSLLQLNFEETRPNGTIRYTNVKINIPGEYFAMDQKNDEEQIIREIYKGECSHQLNGNAEIPEEDIKRLRLTCERTAFMRNYYTYLWGLPMKLHDQGTIFGKQVEMSEFNGEKAYKLRVSYDPNVGSDVWYFYFDLKSYKLLGYRFYHDEAKNDGEYILLEDEIKIAGMRLPKVRKWYTHQDDKFLGTDTLVKGK